jgi:hypothetical protein
MNFFGRRDSAVDCDFERADEWITGRGISSKSISLILHCGIITIGADVRSPGMPAIVRSPRASSKR